MTPQEQQLVAACQSAIEVINDHRDSTECGFTFFGIKHRLQHAIDQAMQDEQAQAQEPGVYAWGYDRIRSSVILHFPDGQQLPLGVPRSITDTIFDKMMAQFQPRRQPEDSFIPTDAQGNEEIEDRSLDSDRYEGDVDEHPY